MKELQRTRGLTTGRLDARFSGWSYDLLGEYAEYDPQDVAITGAFTSAFNNYVRDELKFGQDKVYRTGSDEAGNNWDWKHRGGGDNFGFPGSPNVEGDLIQAMLANPHLQVEVENGIYDLATPFFATEYTMEHLALPEKLQKNIHLQYYDAGHMMYLNLADLKKQEGNRPPDGELDANAKKIMRATAPPSFMSVCKAVCRCMVCVSGSAP
jgi:carboxypeptidase C (cathepsin A)